MKQFLPLMAFLLAFAAVHAQTSQILFNENFTGYTTSNLNGQGSWNASGNDNFATVANTTPLTYPTYTSGGNYANVVQRADYANFTFPFFHAPDDPYKNFISNNTVSTTSSSSAVFYMTFVVRVPSATTTARTADARATLALRTTSSSNLGYFYIADNNNTTDLRFGIQKDGAADGIYATGVYSFNTTYLITIRYDVVNGNNNDRMYMWVNPLLSAEPTTASANVAITSGTDGGYTGSVSGLQLFQEQYSASASLDAFRIAYARNFSSLATTSLAAWNVLNPVGAPLPVTFGEIKAYNKESGVQVDWTVHTEINVSHYEVERSANGVSFEKIGSVTAQAKDGVLYYTYFDAMAAAGVHFYRIKNVDLDNKYSYSPVVKVSSGKSSAERVTIYPNPVQDNRVNLQTGNLAKGTYTVEIFNAAGQQVYTKVINHSGGAATQSLQLPANTKAGIYTIRVKSNEVNAIKQFLVQ